MRCIDVNVLVNAHRPEAPEHEVARSWLESARVAPESLGVAGAVASGFLRVVTHARVFREPTPVPVALDFVAAVFDSPSVVRTEPGDRHWEIFVDLCGSLGLRGNDIPDAYLAALALEHGATWVTADRGFGRFPDLRVEYPASA